MKDVILKNRYNDEISFTNITPKEYVMGGGKYVRTICENNYSNAYATYIEELPIDSKPLTMEEFKKELYRNDENEKYGRTEVNIKYVSLVTPSNKIYAVDPSGGPFVSKGMDLHILSDEFDKDTIVESIDSSRYGGYILTIK